MTQLETRHGASIDLLFADDRIVVDRRKFENVIASPVENDVDAQLQAVELSNRTGA